MPARGGVHALYVDNEGHVIEYTVTATDNPKRAVFVSSETPGAPRFRLSYELNADGSVGGKFEMAPPGGALAGVRRGEGRGKSLHGRRDG